MPRSNKVVQDGGDRRHSSKTEREVGRKHKIVYDPVLKRPGCILLQVMGGGTVTSEDIFMMGDWLTEQTPNMGLFEVTSEELEVLQKISLRKRGT